MRRTTQKNTRYRTRHRQYKLVTDLLVCLGCVLCFLGHSSSLLVCSCAVLVSQSRMKRVMQPFRAPRSGVDKTQERVHRKDNSAHFKEMERWMDKNLTGEGVVVKASQGIETSPA
jgi:hypothetical protein